MTTKEKLATQIASAIAWDRITPKMTKKNKPYRTTKAQQATIELDVDGKPHYAIVSFNVNLFEKGVKSARPATQSVFADDDEIDAALAEVENE